MAHTTENFFHRQGEDVGREWPAAINEIINAPITDAEEKRAGALLESSSFAQKIEPMVEEGWQKVKVPIEWRERALLAMRLLAKRRGLFILRAGLSEKDGDSFWVLFAHQKDSLAYREIGRMPHK